MITVNSPVGLTLLAANVSSSPISMAASFNTAAIWLEQDALCSIQAIWTGSPVGNLSLQTSLNPATAQNGASIPEADWTDYTDSSTAAGGAAGNVTWRVTDVGDRWMRVVYTRTSGTGTVNIRFNAKGA